jgi:hypothetical protein
LPPDEDRGPYFSRHSLDDLIRKIRHIWRIPADGTDAEPDRAPALDGLPPRLRESIEAASKRMEEREAREH